MLRIGFAAKDFTPSRPAMIMGQMHVRVGREAMDPLTMTAMAIDGGDGGARAILISCDLCMASDEVMSAVRARLAKRLPELPADALLMAATHTHESLVIEDNFYTHPGGDVMTTAECFALVADRAADAAVEAWQARKPRQIGRAFGHAVVGHNRRAAYADGSALMYGQTNRPDFVWIEGCEDHGLDMLPVWEADGRLTGIVLAIPCPSQVEEQLCVFSADYWHDVRLELRRRLGPGLAVVALCQAAGDQSPHFLLCGRQEEEMRQRRGVTERQEIAIRVADAVERALACTKPAASETKFSHITRRVELAGFRINRTQRDWALAQHEICRRDGQDMTSWWPTRLKLVADFFDRGESLSAAMTEIHGLRIGDAGIVTSPFELFLDYGMRIKARSGAAQTLVVQLACGTGMYLPTQRAVQGGHYSAIPAVCQVGPEGGQQLVDASLAMLGEMFPA